jgi:hypothetical protein
VYKYEQSSIMISSAESSTSFFDVYFDLSPVKIIFKRKLFDILTIVDEIGGFSESVFGALLIIFTAYSSANFKLEFI